MPSRARRDWSIAAVVGYPCLPGVTESGFEQLPISFQHAAETRNLPDHHRDPFDRLLIAQARVECLVVVTHDPLFVPYGLDLIRT